VLENTDDSPEAQVMRQQMEQMAQAMEQTTAQIQQLMNSYEMNKLKIDEFNSQVKAFDAETKRISAVQNSMTPEQISDIVQGTIAAALDTGDLIGQMPSEPRALPEFEQ